MPTPKKTPPNQTGADTPKQSAKWNVFRNILDYARAMRTAPTISPDEAAEWVALEQEFTLRADETKNAA